MESQKISIIIPVFNVEKYIAECLESCINQSLKDIEIIIVDDCGNDRSMDIAKEYANKDNRIKIIHNKENLKSMKTRFEGAKVATSPYIMFLDSDDFLELNACEILWNLAQNKHYDRIAFGAWRVTQDADKTIFKEYVNNEFLSLESFVNWQYGQKWMPWSIWGNLIKKEICLSALEYIDKDLKITMADDVLANFVIWNLCSKVLHSSYILYNYRYNPQSTTAEKNIDKMKINLKDMDLVLQEMHRISLQPFINKKLAKLFIKIFSHERYVMYYDIKTLSQDISIIDRILHWLEKRFYVLQRKIRTSFGNIF